VTGTRADELPPLALERYRLGLTGPVTQLVRDWLDGVTAVHGIALVANAGGTNVAFDGKESNATSHEPHLQVTLSKVPDPMAGPIAIQAFTTTGAQTYTPTDGALVAIAMRIRRRKP